MKNSFINLAEVIVRPDKLSNIQNDNSVYSADYIKDNGGGHIVIDMSKPIDTGVQIKTPGSDTFRFLTKEELCLL